tara:strand:+ start:618 stop:1211 length:594 start_codon:yes stop_codon:yes gene_type:complete
MNSRYAVFWEPNNTLNDRINFYKEFFIKMNINSKYLNHPPHLSIYVFESNDRYKNKIKNSFSEIGDISINKIKIKNWKIFHNDPLTKLNTLCIELELTKELAETQIKIAEALSPYKIISNSMKFDKIMDISYKKWGFPFVGSHWIPHLTIGSLSIIPEKIKKIISNFELVNEGFKIKELSLYKIDGDNHIFLKKIIL